MQDSDQAKRALAALHSRNIYDACNTLQVDSVVTDGQNGIVMNRLNT